MSPSSNAEFPMHRVHEVSKSPGKRLCQADVRLQAPKCSLLPGDLGAWPGFCRQGTLLWASCQCTLLTSLISAMVQMPQLHPTDISSLFISFISATGQALCTTSHVQLVLSRMLWELVLTPDLIRKRLKLVIIKLCSGQAGLSLQLILCFPERRESS